MDILTIIITALSSSGVTTILSAIVLRRKNAAEAQKIADEVFINRIKFLNEKMEKLEKSVCFRTSCGERVL